MQASRGSRWWRVLDLRHSADIINHVCSSKTDLFFVYGIELLSLAFKWRTWSTIARCSISYCLKYWVWSSALKGLYGKVSANIWELGWLWGVFSRSCLPSSYLWFSKVAKLDCGESGGIGCESGLGLEGKKDGMVARCALFLALVLASVWSWADHSVTVGIDFSTW